MERMEMVEKVREKANVTFEEARDALENNNWDILDAMVELERQGRVNSATAAGARAASGPADEQYYETVEPTASGRHGKEQDYGGRKNRSGKGTLQKIWDKIVELFKKSLENSFVVSKDEEVEFCMPVLVLIILLLAAFWVTLPLLVVGLFFNMRYSFQGKELGKESINNTMSKATDFAQEIAREVREERGNGDKDNSGEEQQ